MWDALLQDLRYAGRALRRSPGFTLVAVLTLALGIGANTAIFSVVNGVLLRPLPYPSPDRLARLFTAFRGSGTERYAMSQPEFMDYKGADARRSRTRRHITGASLTLTSGCATKSGACEPERVRGIAATRDLFPVLGVTPARGRNFEGDEGRAGREPVVIVTHEFWQNRFGGDPSLLGRVLTLNGVSRRVIGILPPDVTIAQAEAFIPIYINPDSLAGRASNYLSGVARLAPNVTVEQAQRELNALTRTVAARIPQTCTRRAWGTARRSSPCARRSSATSGRRSSSCSAPLASSCSSPARTWRTSCSRAAKPDNERSLFASRSARIAAGSCASCSPRARCSRSPAAFAGRSLAWWGMKALLAVNPDAIPRLELVRIDATVGLATLAVALITGLAVRSRAGAADGAPRAALVAQGRNARRERGRGAAAPRTDAGGRRGCAGRGRRHRRRAAHAELLDPARTSIRASSRATCSRSISRSPPRATTPDATTTFYRQLVERTSRRSPA